MPNSDALPPHSVVTTTLRGAGCVFAEEEARLLLAAAVSPAEIESMIRRRVAGIPLEHILGWAQFCGLRIRVDEGVFVPRQRTRFLVDQAALLARRAARVTDAARGRGSASAGDSGNRGRHSRARVQDFARPVVVDLCCGSGAIGAALAARLTEVDLYAADIDPAAVRCARRNLAGTGRVFEGDLFDALPFALRGRVDVLVANTPYVPTEAIGMMPPEARLHEARIALDGGVDGLDIQRRIAAESHVWLSPGGHLLVETSEQQAPQTATIFASVGMMPRITRSDQLNAVVVIGTKPSG